MRTKRSDRCMRDHTKRRLETSIITATSMDMTINSMLTPALSLPKQGKTPQNAIYQN